MAHVTLVAGEPVEMQVRALLSGLYVRLVIVGGAEGNKMETGSQSYRVP